METENDATLIMELNKPTNNDDLDFIKLFLETRKKSDGGDIKFCQDIDRNKKFKIIFEEADTKKRLLDKKCISFRDYLIRFSENGYRHQSYELNNKSLIIKNIHDETDNRVYAIYLMPENDIKQISKSFLFNNTYYVEYANEIDKEALMTRYRQKSQFKNIDIELLDSYQTNTYIIKHSDTASSVQHLASKLLDMNTNKYFIDNIDDSYSLIQFDSRLPNDLFLSLNEEMKLNNYTVESLFNFKLLDHLNHGWIEKLSAKKSKTNKNVNVIFDSYTNIDSNKIDLKQINRSNYIILDENKLSTRSILKCYKIFNDFKKDLQNISSDIDLYLSDSQVVVKLDGDRDSLISKINDLCSVYENDKLSLINIDIHFINHKKPFDIFYKKLKGINSNVEIQKKFHNFCGSNKCVQINLIENNKIIEIYGYKEAVSLCEIYVNRRIRKSADELKRILLRCFDIKFTTKANPVVDVFYKFENNIYLSILNKSLLQLNAIAVLTNCKKMIKIESFNDYDLEKNKEFSKLCSMFNNVSQWSDQVNKCVASFLSNFSLVILKIPFKPTDQESFQIMYDKNRLDIVWLDENRIRILGVKSEIDKFKKELY